MNKNQLKYFLEKHGPDILSGLATVGVGATALLSGRAGAKICKAVGDGKQRTLKEKFKDTWKYYILPSLAGGATVASIWASRKISASQLASMAAAASYLVSNRNRLEEKLKEENHDEAVKAAVECQPLPISFEETGNGDLLCFESFSGRWFKSSVEAVKKAEKQLQDSYKESYEYTKQKFGELDACGYASLNDFYSFLGIQTTYFGDRYGWCTECNGPEIEFNNYFTDIDNGLGEIYVIEISYYNYPFEGYMEY